MSTSQSETTIVESVDQVLRDAQKCAERKYGEFEEKVREAPGTALLTALAAGYVLNQLPLRTIIAAKIKLASALFPPALFLFGAAKIYEFATQETAKAETSSAPPANAP